MLLHHLTLNVNWGSKIAVVEKNGYYGKSTLIKMIQGELPGMDGCLDSSTITMTDWEWHPERPTSDIATILSS
jgi:ABC-type transport system involved in cytochrome bd biosynthesis fused ATPase/permease subunit